MIFLSKPEVIYDILKQRRNDIVLPRYNTYLNTGLT